MDLAPDCQKLIQGKSHPIRDVTLPSSDSMNSMHQLNCNLGLRLLETFSKRETSNTNLPKHQVTVETERRSKVRKRSSSAWLWGQKEDTDDWGSYMPRQSCTICVMQKHIRTSKPSLPGMMSLPQASWFTAVKLFQEWQTREGRVLSGCQESSYLNINLTQT